MFRNPLVSPDILGASAGCGLGASVVILLGLPIALVPLSAFGAGLAAVGHRAVVTLVARRVGEQDPVLVLVLVLVLAGGAAGALLGAGISLLTSSLAPLSRPASREGQGIPAAPARG